MSSFRFGTQTLIDDSALESWMQALEGEVEALEIGDKVKMEVAIKALNNGSSLTEITQQAIWQLERLLIAHVLNVTEGNKLAAARLLKIDYKTLYRKLYKYVI